MATATLMCTPSRVPPAWLAAQPSETFARIAELIRGASWQLVYFVEPSWL